MKKKDRKPIKLSTENESTSNQTDSKTRGNITEFPGQKKQKTDQQQMDHAPQGDLIADLSNKLSCKEQTFKEIPIKKLKHFNIVKDFTLPTRSAYPIVIIFKDTGHCHCIDGWNLVQATKEKGQDSIKCHVFYMESFDIAAASIFKTALRSMPLGGTCSHAEMIYNIRICFRAIKGGNEVPKSYGHGGVRKGTKFNNKLDQDIINLLADQLGKPKRKIREYINHGDGLSDEILLFLIGKGAGRRLFEAIQKNKSNVLAKLQQNGSSDDEIQKAISARVKEWYTEYSETGEIVNELKKTKLTSEEADEIPAEIVRPQEKAPHVHNRWMGNSSPVENSPQTAAQIYNELLAIIDPIIQVKEEKPDITEDFIQQVLGVSKQLLLLSETMSLHLGTGQTESEKEVA